MVGALSTRCPQGRPDRRALGMNNPKLNRVLRALFCAPAGLRGAARGREGLAPWRFFIFNAAGGIAWATIFGMGGYLLGEGIRRIAGPVGWALLALAVVLGFVSWRSKHEETLLAKAEREMARQG